MPIPPPLLDFPPESSDLESLLRRYRLNQELSHEVQARTPGTPAHASQAISDLFPTPLHLTSQVPGLETVSDAAMTYKALMDERYGDAALNGLGLLLPGVGAGVIRAIKEPTKTVKAYRAHRVFGPTGPGSKKYGHLYPAMIGKDTNLKTALSQQLPLGVTLKSELIPFTMAERQGWHAGDLPYGEQFNVGPGKKLQPANTVYTEVDLGADRDFSRYTDPKAETIIYTPGGAELPFDQTKLPEGGFYLYKNPSTPYPWMVSDYVKHNRILTDEEIADIFRSKGLEPPPPRIGGVKVDEAWLRYMGLL